MGPLEPGFDYSNFGGYRWRTAAYFDATQRQLDPGRRPHGPALRPGGKRDPRIDPSRPGRPARGRTPDLADRQPGAASTARTGPRTGQQAGRRPEPAGHRSTQAGAGANRRFLQRPAATAGDLPAAGDSSSPRMRRTNSEPRSAPSRCRCTTWRQRTRRRPSDVSRRTGTDRRCGWSTSSSRFSTCIAARPTSTTPLSKCSTSRDLARELMAEEYPAFDRKNQHARIQGGCLRHFRRPFRPEDPVA